MLPAISCMGWGMAVGTASTQGISSSRVMAVTSARFLPQSRLDRACSLRRVPPQSGQSDCFRNRSTRFMPLSSFTLARAFSTV